MSERVTHILWKLCTTSIARVHGDEVANGRIHGDADAHEVKPLFLLPDCILDALHLDGNDREHLHSDPVELIKAPPCTSLGEALEDVATGLVVHLLGAVEDVDHDANGSSQVFSGLCLACSSWSLWCSTHDQMQALSQGDVTPEKEDEIPKSFHLSVSGVMTRRGVFPRYS